jgi:hypothetical protein
MVRHKVVPLHDQHAGALGDLRVLPTAQTSTRRTHVFQEQHLNNTATQLTTLDHSAICIRICADQNRNLHQNLCDLIYAVGLKCPRDDGRRTSHGLVCRHTTCVKAAQTVQHHLSYTQPPTQLPTHVPGVATTPS